MNAQTPDLEGGKFERSPDGKLASRVEESANAPFRREIPNSATRAERREGVRLITQMSARSGITSVNDPQGSPEDLVAYQDAYDADELSVRVYAFVSQNFIVRMLPSGARSGPTMNGWLRTDVSALQRPTRPLRMNDLLGLCPVGTRSEI